MTKIFTYMNNFIEIIEIDDYLKNNINIYIIIEKLNERINNISNINTPKKIC